MILIVEIPLARLLVPQCVERDSVNTIAILAGCLHDKLYGHDRRAHKRMTCDEKDMKIG